MDFEYCEMDGYYIVLFKVKNIPFSALVDKESKDVFSIEALTYGKCGDHVFEERQPMKEMTFLPVSCFEIEDAIKEFFMTM